MPNIGRRQTARQVQAMAETFTLCFIGEGALVDFEFMTFAGMMELLRCPFVEAYFPMADVQQEEVIVAHWMSCKVITLM